LPAGATCSGTDAGSGLTINPNGQTIPWGNLSLTSGAKLTIGAGRTTSTTSLCPVAAPDDSSGEVTMTVVNTFSLAGNSIVNIGTTTHLNVGGHAQRQHPDRLQRRDGLEYELQLDAFPDSVRRDWHHQTERRLGEFGGRLCAQRARSIRRRQWVFTERWSGKTITDQGGTIIYYDRHLKETRHLSARRGGCRATRC
jgi:hypothetical protein